MIPLNEAWSISYRTVIMYFLILVIIRLMGKREVGSLSVFDLTVSFMLANLSAIVLEAETPLFRAIVPTVVLGMLQIFTAWVSLKSTKIRSLTDGEPVVIIKNGKIQDHNMGKNRYNIDDLLTQLRAEKISSVNDVEFAVVETSGKLSVFPKSQTPKHFRLPVPVIIEGTVQLQALEECKRSVAWLKMELLKRGYKDFKDIYYASIDSQGQLYVDALDE